MRKSDLILPNYPIRKGDRGLDVSRLQACLDMLYKRKGKKKLEALEPAYMGSYTMELLYHFQTEKEIRATGEYDRITRQKLREVIHAD